ncbi:MAG: hypothetical protein WAO95_13420 [Burkholderiales bacterium]
MSRRRLVIAGAAGRDFHNFNAVYRDDPGCEVVAFTAAQIPGIDARRYPASLAGALYPEGIAIVGEERLEELLRERAVDEVVLGYRDLSHLEVMHLASRALAGGADFMLLGPRRTMLAATRRTLDAVDAELIVSATPADLARLIPLEKPVLRARYEFEELEPFGLWNSVERLLAARRPQPRVDLSQSAPRPPA